LCIPFEVYLKKWNELKTIQTHAKMKKWQAACTQSQNN
jgi:hypothetical protein